mmetsp:Transcript_16417/g.22897  ORF Transcript_16417/g.22897 Transcript_16417/m.22897 type:complete len:444 (-) Transcript_16417:47-1378(-)
MAPLWLSLLLLLFPSSLAIDNGKGMTPPMGWRSWNLYGTNVNQKLIMKIMDGMASRKRTVDGKPTSLCDLGYCDVGLDDNWQVCGHSPKHDYTYHSDAGSPIVNEKLFPDLKAMTNHAHSLNLTAGWYFNNCICRETSCGNGKDHGETDESCYRGDVEAIVKFGFDSVKLDGCGTQRDLSVWARLFEEKGKSIMIENCHWGETVPNKTWCPFNFYRTTPDVRASYASVLQNLRDSYKFIAQNLSYPGCWAYPDMLEVGCQHGPGGSEDPGLSMEETRTHFGAWAIVSSPLTLSHDVNNDTIMDQIWPIISNKEIIEVNRAYAGFSGGPFATSKKSITIVSGDDKVSIPTWTLLYKPLAYDNSKVAVLLMNSGDSAEVLALDFDKIPGFKCSRRCSVRDLWTHEDLGKFDSSYGVRVKSHDAAFVVVSTTEHDISQLPRMEVCI